MNTIKKMLSKYVFAFIFVTVICALVFVSVQQSLRYAANDPQIQIVEDGVVSLKDNDQRPLFGPDKFDLEKSLGTFIALYDKDGKVLESNATLNGEAPQPPQGIFEAAKNKGHNEVTWKPKDNVRQALVIMPIGNQAGEFLLAGRSLREVEKRTNQIFIITSVAWAGLLLLSFAYIAMNDKKSEHSEEHTHHHPVV